MKFTRLSILFLLAAGLFQSCLDKDEPLMAIGGSGWKQVAVADKAGKVLWQHPLEKGEECNTVALLEGDKLLYSTRGAAKVVDRNHDVLWEYKVKKGQELHSALTLDNGNILLGICGHPAQILEINEAGEAEVTIALELDIKNPHAQFRRVRKMRNGNYLLPLMGKRKVMEIDPDGKVVREVATTSGSFAAIELENGNWLLSLGDSHRLVEMNPNTGEEVWQISQNDIEGQTLHFVAEALRLENGNTLICSWGGHSRGGAAQDAQVLEVTPDKELVWSLNDHEKFGNISTLDINWDKNYVK